MNESSEDQSKSNDSPTEETRPRKGRAVFWTIIGVCLLTASVAYWWVASEATRRANTSQSRWQLKQMGLQAHNFHEVRRAFPTAANHQPGAASQSEQFLSVLMPRPKPATENTPPKTAAMSWETVLMPFDSSEAIFPLINKDEVWNSPANAAAFRRRIELFENPAIRKKTDDAGYGLSHYSGNVHVMGGSQGMTFKQITDGASNTLLIGEIYDGFQPWAKPGNVRDPADGLTGEAHNFGGPFPEGVQFVMGDGSAKMISRNIDPAILKAISTPAGGERVRNVDF